MPGISSRLLVSLTVAVSLPGDPASDRVIDTFDWEEPLTISASTVGRFRHGHSWYFSVNSAGQAELTIMTIPNTRRRIVITGNQLEAFRKAMKQERFFELGDAYGQHVFDGSTESLAVTLGNRTKAVEVHYLMNWVGKDQAKLREPARAVRLLVMIRGWIKDTEAVDLRPYDRKILDAVKE
jgi:hypothetical protein